MDMLLVSDVFVVELVRAYPFLVVCSPEEGHEIALEVVAEVVDVLARVFANDCKLPDVRFALDVTFEAVGVATLLLTGLTPPAQAL